MSELQSYANHRRFVRGYHVFLTLFGLVYIGWSLYVFVFRFSIDAVFQLVLAAIIFLLAAYVRVFPLGVQDRLIRLEERLRLARLAPEDLKGRLDRFSTKQLIGLRFASDAELPDLARRVLDENIADTDAIKQAIKEWRPDNQRI